MTNRIMPVVLNRAIALLSIPLWGAAAILWDRQNAQRSRAGAEETRAGLCLGDTGNRYSDGALLATKRGPMKYEHGHGIAQAPR